MSALAQDLVTSLREGDLVRVALTDYAGPYTVEGRVRSSEDGALFVGPVLVRFVTGGALDVITSLEIVERAERAFYTNQPAIRSRRKGDVAQVDHDAVRVGGWTFDRGWEFVFNGRVWLAVETDEPVPYGTRPLDFRPGQLALIDPAQDGAS